MHDRDIIWELEMRARTVEIGHGKVDALSEEFPEDLLLNVIDDGERIIKAHACLQELRVEVYEPYHRQLMLLDGLLRVAAGEMDALQDVDLDADETDLFDRAQASGFAVMCGETPAGDLIELVRHRISALAQELDEDCQRDQLTYELRAILDLESPDEDPA